MGATNTPQAAGSLAFDLVGAFPTPNFLPRIYPGQTLDFHTRAEVSQTFQQIIPKFVSIPIQGLFVSSRNISM